MELGPILRSMRHHKGAFSLLVLEVAFGFVILVHALIYARYYAKLGIVSPGLPVEELTVVERRFLHPRSIESARAQQRADLAALGRLGAVSAAALDTVPLPDSATFPMLLRGSGSDGLTHMAWLMLATPGVVDALGLELIVGRRFDDGPHGPGEMRPVLISRRTANDLFGQPEDALGRTIDGGSRARGIVVGVVENFALRGVGVPQWQSAVIVDDDPATQHELIYVLRSPAGQRPAVIEAARRTLEGTGSTADAVSTVRPLVFEDVRFARISRGAIVVLAWTGFLVVAVALAGSLALSSFSVAERTRQIGVRRALGARRSEIVAYFLLENLILTVVGLAIGLLLAFALNRALLQMMSNISLQPDVVLFSMGIFLSTGLLSAMVPARRAAAIPPWAATRTL